MIECTFCGKPLGKSLVKEGTVVYCTECYENKKDGITVMCKSCQNIIHKAEAEALVAWSTCPACTHAASERMRKALKRVTEAWRPPQELPPFRKNFTEAVRTMQHAVHENAVAHGWWDSPREDGTILMLVVSELAEMLEAMRDGGGESKKIPGFSCEEEELADAVIRIFDFAGRKNYRLGAAILAKHEFNKTRPHKHGGKAF